MSVAGLSLPSITLPWFRFRLRFGLRTLLLLVLPISLGLSAYHNIYRHHREIYEHEEAVMSFLASGRLADYHEEPSSRCGIGPTLYQRPALKYATRSESVPWWSDHAWSPVDR